MWDHFFKKKKTKTKSNKCLVETGSFRFVTHLRYNQKIGSINIREENITIPNLSSLYTLTKPLKHIILGSLYTLTKQLKHIILIVIDVFQFSFQYYAIYLKNQNYKISHIVKWPTKKCIDFIITR